MAKIIKHKTSNVVAYMFDDSQTVTLTAERLDAPFVAYGVSSDSHEIVSGNAYSGKFKGGKLTYDGSTWAKTDAYDVLSDSDIEHAKSNRKKRNALLSETDYFALSDVTMDAAMTTYRQALRDITTHANWPNLADNDWPTKP